jgi:hypothetical protein
MNIASLALVSALAAVAGCAQPVLAQTQDQTGATMNRSGAAMTDHDGSTNAGAANGDADRDSATTGAAQDQQRGNSRDDENEDSAAANNGSNWNRNRRWSNRAPMMMGPMWRRHRQMMLGGAGGAQFHFARGKARIDVRCSVQEDTQACVRAAGELLDKIAQLHRSGRDDTTGSAGRDDDRSGGPAPEDQQEDRAAPAGPGERM